MNTTVNSLENSIGLFAQVYLDRIHPWQLSGKVDNETYNIIQQSISGEMWLLRTWDHIWYHNHIKIKDEQAHKRGS